MTQRQFYKSKPWLRARRAYIDRRIAIDGGICEVCGQALGYIVHHKIWLNDVNCNDPDIALNQANFRYECLDCHNREVDPAKGQQAVGRVRFGPDGAVIPVGDY